MKNRYKTISLTEETAGVLAQVRYCIHKNQPLVFMQSEMNVIHASKTDFPMTRLKTVPWLRSLVTGLSQRRPGFTPGQSMWDLWRTKWHWDRFFSEFFGFLL
jgi:hypothetical protein